MRNFSKLNLRILTDKKSNPCTGCYVFIAGHPSKFILSLNFEYWLIKKATLLQVARSLSHKQIYSKFELRILTDKRSNPSTGCYIYNPYRIRTDCMRSISMFLNVHDAKNEHTVLKSPRQMRIGLSDSQCINLLEHLRLPDQSLSRLQTILCYHTHSIWLFHTHPSRLRQGIMVWYTALHRARLTSSNSLAC